MSNMKYGHKPCAFYKTYSTKCFVDLFFDLYIPHRKCMSGCVANYYCGVVWEPSPDKSIIFALEAAKIMPILTHLMTAINKSLYPGSQASEETIMGN